MKQPSHAIRLLLFGLTLFAMLFVTSIASAQDAGIEMLDDDFVSTIIQLRERGRLSDENEQLFEAYLTERLRREKEKIVEARRIIALTERNASVVFWIAHVAVLIGFISAMIEFIHANRLRSRGKDVGEIDLKVQMESMALRTSSVGLVLLLVSIVFYFMYLRFVYPIQIVGA